MGAPRNRLTNHLNDSLDVCQHIIVSKAQHAITQMFKHRLPPRIVFLLRLVNWAIYFNNQTRLTGVEIDDETVNAVLAAKFDAQLPMAQTLPELIFSKSEFLAQLTRVGASVSPYLSRSLPLILLLVGRSTAVVFHEDTDSHSLPDVEDVFIGAAIRCGFTLQTVAL